MLITFVVPGPPLPAPRATQIVREDGTRIGAFTRSRKTGMSYPDYKLHVARIALGAMTHVGHWNREGPHSVALRFFRERSIGDIDNLCKTALDSCNGVLWDDDRTVRRIVAEIHDDQKTRPRVEFEARCL